VTADEFETLDELEAELWIARRFRAFVNSGFPPDLSLIFAVHPDVAVPAPEERPTVYVDGAPAGTTAPIGTAAA
jgi:hypothetical protein